VWAGGWITDWKGKKGKVTAVRFRNDGTRNPKEEGDWLQILEALPENCGHIRESRVIGFERRKLI